MVYGSHIAESRRLKPQLEKQNPLPQVNLNLAPFPTAHPRINDTGGELKKENHQSVDTVLAVKRQEPIFWGQRVGWHGGHQK
jgi:hypothetical protein